MTFVFCDSGCLYTLFFFNTRSGFIRAQWICDWGNITVRPDICWSWFRNSVGTTQFVQHSSENVPLTVYFLWLVNILHLIYWSEYEFLAFKRRFRLAALLNSQPIIMNPNSTGCYEHSIFSPYGLKTPHQLTTTTARNPS